MPSRCLGLALILLAGGAAPLAGQASPSPPPTGKPELSLFAGFGYGVKVHFGRTEEQLLLVEPQVGIPLGSRFEYLIEGHLAKYFRPAGFAAGLVPLGVRYVFASGTVAPYVELGAGVCWTNLEIIELSRRFNFILQGGLGVRGIPGLGQTWTVEARFLHYSNANTVRPNLGLNAAVLLAGWRFR